MIPRSDWRRRHALQLASQLPDDTADALAVLDHTRELVLTFLQPATVGQPKTNISVIRAATPE